MTRGFQGCLSEQDVVVSLDASTAVVTAIYCDIGDLFFYLRNHENVSGIQRVLSTLISIVNSFPLPKRPIVWCTVDPIRDELRSIEVDQLGILIEAMNTKRIDREELDQILDNIDQQLVPCEPERGSLFFILGAFWVFDHASNMLLRMQRKGVRTALLVYDLIPIEHPEYCERGLTTVFTRQLRSILPLLDCAVAISEHVRKQFSDYAARSNFDIPVAAIPLGHDKLVTSGLSRRQDVFDLEGDYWSAPIERSGVYVSSSSA